MKFVVSVNDHMVDIVLLNVYPMIAENTILFVLIVGTCFFIFHFLY